MLYPSIQRSTFCYIFYKDSLAWGLKELRIEPRPVVYDASYCGKQKQTTWIKLRANKTLNNDKNSKTITENPRSKTNQNIFIISSVSLHINEFIRKVRDNKLYIKEMRFSWHSSATAACFWIPLKPVSRWVINEMYPWYRGKRIPFSQTVFYKKIFLL